MPRSRKVKTFSYRLSLAAGETAVAESLAEWWDGFEWVTGPVMVFWKAQDVGKFQVWAVSESEGRGVIAHALAHMGVDPSVGTWRTAVVTNPRFGKVYTVRATAVSCRNGSAGPPTAVILDRFALADPVNPPAEA